MEATSTNTNINIHYTASTGQHKAVVAGLMDTNQ